MKRYLRKYYPLIGKLIIKVASGFGNGTELTLQKKYRV
ncbi:hypothetical protein LEP1GSC168_4075 [Leptospira santarosai str. HAI134]|nr:hypothetical protein LEP1GSC168_4075 [Leptospira santarosai str. HAI134]